MGDKPLIITLDPFVVGKSNENEENKPLTKYGEESAVLDYTFRQLTEYMLDPNSNDLNPNGYNKKETETAKRIEGWFEEMARTEGLENRKTTVDIFAPNDEDPVHPKGPYSLTARVGDHTHEIMTANSEKVDGEEVPYKSIELIIRKTQGGGSISRLENELYTSPHILEGV